MNRTVLLALAAAFVMFAMPPRARAIDPITMAILAPIALKVADAAKPFIIRSVVGTFRGVFNIGKAALEILYLPLGIGEITIGLAFNKGRSGLIHIIRGGMIAPFKMLINVLILPVHMTGIKLNI